MKDDVRKYIYGALIAFLVVVTVWVGFIFVNACGFTLTCTRGARAVDRTPMPTLPPATLPAAQAENRDGSTSDQCLVAAVDLIGAWVEAGYPEKEEFVFTDINGLSCRSSFNEIQPLFIEPNLLLPGSLSCVSCHSVDVAISPAQLDMSSYAGIMAGSRRPDANAMGRDILGAGEWENSLLYEFLSVGRVEVPGHTDVMSELLVPAGEPLPSPPVTASPAPTETPTDAPVQ